MRSAVPHPIPYQGSKRRLAQAILSHVEAERYTRLIEPFAGSGAVTIAAARHEKFARFVLGDKLEPLAVLWQSIIENPGPIACDYAALWHRERNNPIDEYYKIRNEFNRDRSPAKLLYLLARCVKNAVRFNPAGEFNQSPDKRRAGTRPDSMRKELTAAHRLLAGRAEAVCADFLDLFQTSRPGDFFYLDPPYQGTSEGRDSRYIGGITRERIIEGLAILNDRGNAFILSYDGACGDRTYGERLPAELASRVLLDVGRSSQATLNGNEDITVESLYISHDLVPAGADGALMTLHEFEPQHAITGLLF
ncbi:MAG TPA: DNA adenine methylase [Terracidiphilus sp.]